MKLLADLHTHSKNSRFGHGKNTIEEMAIAANEMGLVEIGITDHGYKHFFRTTKQKIKEARKIVNEINEWSKTKVLLGIEADIIDEDGTLDIDNETLSMLDILVVGYHRMTVTNFAGYFGTVKNTEEAKAKCTNAFVNAINRYPVTILAPLDSILTTDMYEVGKACAERGTLVEINNRHTNWTDKQMEDLIASGCMFVVSSDAHSRQKVGSVENAFGLIKKYDIPSERVANVEFTEEEKSAEDRAYEAYKSVYNKVLQEKNEREEIIQDKINTEFVGTLSKEMEDALREIAVEQGQEIRSQKLPENYDSFVNDNMDENARILAMAEEYIRKNTIGEQFDSENDSISDFDYTEEVDDSEELSVSDDIPLMKEEDDSFQNKFQALNSLVKDAREETLDEKQDVDVQPKLQAKNKGVEINRTPSKKQEKMANINDKNIIHEPRVVEPENFMSSITRTNLASSGTVAEAKQEEKPKPKATTTAKKRKSGGFIAVDNLIGEDKK